MKTLDMFCLLSCPCRVAPGFPVMSSPLGLISLTTHAVTTVTMTWRGASCLRTSKPGKNETFPWSNANVTKSKEMISPWMCFVWFSSLAADSYEWGSQSSGISAYIGGDESYHLPPPSEELSHYWAEFTVTPADLWLCFFFLLVYFCTLTDIIRLRHKTRKLPSTQYIQFSILSREALTNLSLCQYMKVHWWDIHSHTPFTKNDLIFTALFIV